MLVVKLLIICAKRAAKFGTLLFLAVRRRSHCASASNWDSKAWKFSHTEHKSYACALRILLQQFETNVERVIMSQLRLRMVWPWPDQLDRFRRLCIFTTISRSISGVLSWAFVASFPGSHAPEREH